MCLNCHRNWQSTEHRRIYCARNKMLYNYRHIEIIPFHRFRCFVLGIAVRIVRHMQTFARTHWYAIQWRWQHTERDDYFRVLSSDECVLLFSTTLSSTSFMDDVIHEKVHMHTHARTRCHLYVNMLWCSALKHRQRTNSNQQFSITFGVHFARLAQLVSSAKSFEHFRTHKHTNTLCIHACTPHFHALRLIRGYRYHSHNSLCRSSDFLAETKAMNEHMQFSVQI